jgi:hypothetical protein
MEFVSRRWHDYTGLSSEESRGVGWRAVVHPEDLAELLEKWGVLPDLDVRRECDQRLRGANGVFRRFSLRLEPLLDESGAMVCNRN